MRFLALIASLFIVLLLHACNNKTPSASSKKSSLASQNLTSGPPSVAVFLALKKTILERRQKMDAEKKRRSALMLELMANIGAGCMGDARINSVEIIIDGEKVNDNDVSVLKQADPYLPTDVSQVNFEFYLGDLNRQNSVSFTNNELQNGVFAPNGHYLYTVSQDSNVKIHAIEMLSIKKTVPTYSKTDYCPPPAEGKPAPVCTHGTIKEVQRYQMSSLTIKVNGIALYTKSQVNHVFSANPGSEIDTSQGLTWQENNPQLNDAYIKLIQRTDCPTP
jgi:hypothetical protein